MTISATGQRSAPIFDPTATTRVMLPPGNRAQNKELSAIKKEWTHHPGPNGSPSAYVYQLPDGMAPKEAVVQIAKRLPMPNYDFLDHTKFPDIDLTVTEKTGPKLIKLLDSLAQSQETTASDVLEGVLPYLSKKDSLAYGGISIAHHKDGSADRYDGEFLALVNTTSKEVLFLVDGNLFPSHER